MLSVGEFLKVATVLEHLRGRYEGNLTNVVCDALTIIARAARLKGVPLQAMLDAVRQGGQ